MTDDAQGLVEEAQNWAAWFAAKADWLEQQPVELSASMLADAVKAEAERDELRAEVSQAVAAWFAAERDQLRAEVERLRTGKAIEDAFSQVIDAETEADATQRDLDRARAAVDRVRKLVTDTQTVGWAGIPVMHGGKPFPVMVSVDAVIEALDGEA